MSFHLTILEEDFKNWTESFQNIHQWGQIVTSGATQLQVIMQ